MTQQRNGILISRAERDRTVGINVDNISGEERTHQTATLHLLRTTSDGERYAEF